MSAAQELLDAFPDCQIAVAYVQLIICGKEADEEWSAWDLMMRSVPPMDVDETIDCLRCAMEGEKECKAEEALRETHHPSFREFIAAKIKVHRLKERLLS